MPLAIIRTSAMRARPSRGPNDVQEEEGNDAVVGLGGGEHAPDGVGDEHRCGEEENPGEEGRLGGAGAGEERDAAPGVLLLAADSAGGHEPDTDREERREGKDAEAKSAVGVESAERRGGTSVKGRKNGRARFFPEGV
jgi:hypothetical protein